MDVGGGKPNRGAARQRCEIKLSPDALCRLRVAASIKGDELGRVVERLIHDQLPEVPDTLIHDVNVAV